MDNNEKGKENKGCFIITFIVIASGIFPALHSANEGPIGSFIVVILGICVAWGIAKALYRVLGIPFLMENKCMIDFDKLIIQNQ